MYLKNTYKAKRKSKGNVYVWVGRYKSILVFQVCLLPDSERWPDQEVGSEPDSPAAPHSAALPHGQPTLFGPGAAAGEQSRQVHGSPSVRVLMCQVSLHTVEKRLLEAWPVSAPRCWDASLCGAGCGALCEARRHGGPPAKPLPGGHQVVPTSAMAPSAGMKRFQAARQGVHPWPCCWTCSEILMLCWSSDIISD